MKKYFYLYLSFLVVVIIVLLLIIHNTRIIPNTTYYYSSYDQYSDNGKDNNIVSGSEKTRLSQVLLSRNIHGEGFDTTPIVSGDIIYVGVMNKSNNTGGLFAIKRSNFKILWHDNLPNWVMTNPVVIPTENMVYIGTGNSMKYKMNGKKVLYRGLGSNSMYGINLETGKIIWQYNTLGEDMPTPVYNNGVVYFANGNKDFYALSALSGNLLWKLNIGSIVSMSSAVMIGNNIYFGGASPYKFFDINISTRKVQWSDYFPNITGALDDTTPTYSNGYIYTNSTHLTNVSKDIGYEYLYKINAQTGKIIWTINEGIGIINLPSDPMEGSVSTIIGNTLYTSSNTARKVFAININTEKMLWSYKVNSMINAPFIEYNGLLYILTTAGNIYVLEVNNGEFVAKRTLGGPEIASGLSLYNNIFYAITGNGNIYAFN